LKNKIIKQINSDPERFLPMDDFIGFALYDSENGYYTKTQAKIGREGDFYTSVSVSPVFGEVLAKWINKRAHEHGLPPTICELGAGTGQLAVAIIEGLQKLNFVTKDFHYIVIEGSPYHRSLIKEKTKKYDFLKILSSLEQLEEFDGIILSNEFFDAFPVKVAVNQDGIWKELGVTENQGRLIETSRGASIEMISFIDKIGLKNPSPNQRIEIPMAYLDAYKYICTKIKRGVILSIDYGMLNSDVLFSERINGSLRGFNKHKLVDNILDNPGEVDITSNVLFEELAKQGEEIGFTTISLKKQNEFLLESGILDLLVEHQDRDPFSEKSRRNRSIIQFIHTGDISSYYYVLEQMKVPYSKS
jgi:SAM-dependent MidA family methyltransferase